MRKMSLTWDDSNIIDIHNLSHIQTHENKYYYTP